LHKYLISHGPLNKKSAKILARNLLEAVQTLHERNIIHRDIKPENMLLTIPNTLESLVLSDFGLSKIIDGQ
jgi:serine/threonine protein kinase